jgi:hypothetical protein
MNDTPETDAFIDSLNEDWDVEFTALTTQARKLERERDQWRDMATKLFEQLNQWGCQTPECFCECAVVMRELKQMNKEGI